MRGVMEYLLGLEDLAGTVQEKILDIVFKDSVPTAYIPKNISS